MNEHPRSWRNFQLNRNGNSIQSQFMPNPHREWIRTSFGCTYRHGAQGKRRQHDQTFVVMSYNILAQSLLEKHPHLYNSHVPEFLDWEHRLRCIQNEILAIEPAILCLQEVQESHLTQIETALKPMNYAKPLYKQRTGHGYDDGCAIFYNSKHFQLLDHHYVEFYQPDVKILDRFNVAIIAKFASQRLQHLQFIVATTHLLYNPRRDDIRQAQIQVLLAELDRMAVQTSTQKPLPVILTGDFNSLPFSKPYRLIQDGHIASANLPLQLGIMDNCQHMNVAMHQNRTTTALFNSDKKDENVKNGASDCIDATTSNVTVEYVQKLGLPYNTGSVWHHLNFTPTIISDYHASTHQDRWIMVDYIFYTKYWRRTVGPVGKPPTFSPLQLLASFELPSKYDCQNLGPIPNGQYGSDHYSLAAEFVLLNR